LLIFIDLRLIGTFIEGHTVNALKKENPMLYYSLVFFIVAIIAGLLGFGGIAGAATGIAQILFFVFVVLFVLSLIFGRRRL
jgi:uncharacterized membrane protein YtjA (UPF0391 family)